MRVRVKTPSESDVEQSNAIMERPVQLQPAIATSPAPPPPNTPLVDNSEPWWRYTDWFEDLSFDEIMNRLFASVDARKSSDYVVVPALVVQQIATGRLDEYRSRKEPSFGLADTPHPSTGCEEFKQPRFIASMAREIYGEMLRREGYSTNHMKRAWVEALKFADYASSTRALEAEAEA